MTNEVVGILVCICCLFLLAMNSGLIVKAYFEVVDGETPDDRRTAMLFMFLGFLGFIAILILTIW